LHLSCLIYCSFTSREWSRASLYILWQSIVAAQVAAVMKPKAAFVRLKVSMYGTDTLEAHLGGALGHIRRH
jgi:hypothetical protein